MLKIVILSVENIDSVIYQMNQYVSASFFLMQKSFQKKQKEKVLEPVFKTGFQDFFPGGDDRDRTDDLLNAIQALSQLSYAPVERHL